ncbi:uncharacterized protein LOC110367684 [Fundulus heteroclitus]|uniref:uncharacterized protein LOC110367684 n=1 Tax=Fundulus heteroclitus TaxID=8078 RepID=UPI00165B3B83|nr:uncharacterized protein LOC110367684 [Fundulus heteroclitus]
MGPLLQISHIRCIRGLRGDKCLVHSGTEIAEGNQLEAPNIGKTMMCACAGRVAGQDILKNGALTVVGVHNSRSNQCTHPNKCEHLRIHPHSCDMDTRHPITTRCHSTVSEVVLEEFPAPIFDILIQGESYPFMLGTGARYSTVNFDLITSDRFPEVMGFSGNSQKFYFSKPVECVLPFDDSDMVFLHEFLIKKQCPINLLAHGLIAVLRAAVVCSFSYTDVVFPNGRIVRTQNSNANQMNQAPCLEEQNACVWQGNLLHSSDNSLLEVAKRWDGWITSLCPYSPPADPLHITLNYLRSPEQVFDIDGYQDAWEMMMTFLREKYNSDEPLLWVTTADVVNQPQYPLSPEKVDAIRGTISGLLSSGVLVPVTLPKTP